MDWSENFFAKMALSPLPYKIILCSVECQCFWDHQWMKSVFQLPSISVSSTLPPSDCLNPGVPPLAPEHWQVYICKTTYPPNASLTPPAVSPLPQHALASSVPCRRLVLNSCPGNTRVYETTRVLDEKVTRKVEQYEDPATGKLGFKTVEYIEKVVEHKVGGVREGAVEGVQQAAGLGWTISVYSLLHKDVRFVVVQFFYLTLNDENCLNLIPKIHLCASWGV